MSDLRCVRCGRPLVEAAAEVRNRDGAFSYGPKCARLAGLYRQERARVVRARVNGTEWRDPAQIPLDLGAAE